MFVRRRDECIVSPTRVLEVADAFGQEWAESQFGQMAQDALVLGHWPYSRRPSLGATTKPGSFVRHLKPPDDRGAGGDATPCSLGPAARLSSMNM